MLMVKLQHGGKTYRPSSVIWEEEKPKAPFPWGAVVLVIIVLALLAQCNG
jgi:hypothetical protein